MHLYPLLWDWAQKMVHCLFWGIKSSSFQGENLPFVKGSQLPFPETKSGPYLWRRCSVWRSRVSAHTLDLERPPEEWMRVLGAILTHPAHGWGGLPATQIVICDYEPSDRGQHIIHVHNSQIPVIGSPDSTGLAGVCCSLPRCVANIAIGRCVALERPSRL